MFCIQLNGGLGNQMFQYAFGRAISEKHRIPFTIDCTILENLSQKVDYTLRDFELDIFQLKVNNAHKEQLIKYKPSVLYKINYRLNKLLKLPVFLTSNVVTEKQFNLKLDNELLSSKDLYFSGYWQSEAYFKSIDSIIRSDFTFKPRLNNKNLKLKNKIDASNSVSIHIRRGDYVNNPSAFKTHGVCSVEYYNKSIEEIKQRIKDPVFFIFSDDFEWVRENKFEISNYELVDWNHGKESYIDMQMMSYCKHNIIANSSFSWWGAWLNNNSDKVVIAPKQWFADDVKNANSEKLIPKQWEKL